MTDAKFAERIITLRRTAGLTMQDLAHELNVAMNTIYRWEKGMSKPNQRNTIHQIERLEKKYGMA